MPPCYCAFKRCNGKDIPRSTRKYHVDCDREHPTLRASQPSYTPASVPVGLQPSSSDVVTSSGQCTHEGGNYGTVEVIDDSHALGLLAAEERGRLYIEQMMTSHDIPSSMDDFGDFEEDTVDDTASDIPCLVPISAVVGDVAAVQIPVPLLADPRYPCENDPDPFTTSSENDSARMGASISSQTTPAPLFILYLLVSWLHTHFHVPFLACNAILVVVVNILRASGTSFPAHSPPYTTLTTVTINLGVEPSFKVLPVCPKCLEVYPRNRANDTVCDHCATQLFQSIQRHDHRLKSNSHLRRPFLQFPCKTIEAQLRDILSIAGVEDLIDAWRKKSRIPGVYEDNFDGRICQELKGPNGHLFFEVPQPLDCSELRIGLTLGVDWYVLTVFYDTRHLPLTMYLRFSYHRSQIAPSHSSCPMSFNIINLPPHLR